MSSVSIEQVIEKLKLTNLTPEIDVTGIKIHQPDINRPALQLSGYFEHFEETRPQIIGFVEYSYMEHISDEKKREVYPRVISEKTPCIIFCRNLIPDFEILLGSIHHFIRLVLDPFVLGNRNSTRCVRLLGKEQAEG